MARRPDAPTPPGAGKPGAGTPGAGGSGAKPPRARSPEARRGVAPAPPTAGIADDPGFVLLGEFGRAHGLHGEVRLRSYTADPRAIATYGPLAGADGRRVELLAVRPAGGPGMLVARVAGIAGREAAEALARLALYVARDRLGAPADEDEFLTADLVGLPVTDGAGTVLGTVRAVPNFGGGDLLEIAPAHGGASALLPFTKAFVPEVDVAARRVRIDPPDDLFAPSQARDPDAG
ncbi:Ribosome maturation factor RimM [Methylobacterium crusticola]|uniref:Ribosome maturation factor RimM n=1 Tax=Methylobacterium crusticola TaxID=1697972 RepID=A0ABQ4QZU1_9HYPH|nr:ribosome maturation factor RimM [Methylobacterium crusticola]GJD50848.1 Ribosome maturation factor RimM [Methylobacterium crusticola]